METFQPFLIQSFKDKFEVKKTLRIISTEAGSALQEVIEESSKSSETIQNE